MPCIMPSVNVDRTESNRQLKLVGDELTHALDQIREALLHGEVADFSHDSEGWSATINKCNEEIGFETNGPTSGVRTDVKLFYSVVALYNEYSMYKYMQQNGGPTVGELEGIRHKQTQHRQEDLDRLMHTFVDLKETERLRKCMEADPSKPLEAQLGFNPHKF